MIRTLRRAYGGGWRAGMSNLRRYKWLVQSGKLVKVLEASDDLNPYHGRWQFTQRFFWALGYQDGLTISLNQWLYNRKGY